MTFNKNGIRILDNPKQANKIQSQGKCLPNEHVYRDTGNIRVNESDWNMGINDTLLHEVKCIVCKETDYR